MSAQRRMRRRLAQRDGEQIIGGCPFCSAYVEVDAAAFGFHVHHDDGCIVLAGDDGARLLSNVAAVRLIGQRVGSTLALVATAGGRSVVVAEVRR